MTNLIAIFAVQAARYSEGLITLAQEATEAAQSPLPVWAIVLMAGFPTIGAIATAYLANKKSKEAARKTADLENKKIGKEEFNILTDKYKELYQLVEAENRALREENNKLRTRLEVMEQKLGIVTEAAEKAQQMIEETRPNA